MEDARALRMDAATLRTLTGLLHLAGAAVCAVALTHRLFWGLSSQTIAGQNFFAYLTIQSNVAFAIVWTVAGVAALRDRLDHPRITAAQAVVLSWTATAGIVFAFLVWQAGERAIRIDVPWSDQVLHFWLPALAVLDWLFTPGRGRAPRRVVPIVLAYPLLWGGFTMWRGSLIGWYPYYFLDLRQVSGPPEFLMTSGAALSIFAAVSASLVWARRRHVGAPPEHAGRLSLGRATGRLRRRRRG
ncbi:Pr6Pr family membrane protein [Microbacterium sp. NPDC096154]|uniref:Pr6Pr family membrane protein n=1 Tax=Microbacterium sp. NPDC096154 TaxID=3155549 RepID=UPI003317A233